MQTNKDCLMTMIRAHIAAAAHAASNASGPDANVLAALTKIPLREIFREIWPLTTGLRMCLFLQ